MDDVPWNYVRTLYEHDGVVGEISSDLYCDTEKNKYYVVNRKNDIITLISEYKHCNEDKAFKCVVCRKADK